mmetsp:Transcript_29669/g.68994  ORF Transcript_29669/g.68994 Transcript_29669/m.68994 type:complete len:88 (+) Transcript_29669:29-292(+)
MEWLDRMLHYLWEWQHFKVAGPLTEGGLRRAALQWRSTRVLYLQHGPLSSGLPVGRLGRVVRMFCNLWGRPKCPSTCKSLGSAELWS